MNRTLTWIAAWTILAGMGAIAAYGMVTTPPRKPLPGCSIHHTEPALTIHGATVTSGPGRWQPCVDRTPLHGKYAQWWQQ